MADPTGFMKSDREQPKRRPVQVRISDWREVYQPFAPEKIQTQASRCMDCGIPFCHNGCPLGNLIPEWNDLVRTDNWRAAIDRLHATNNFPEFTGRLCPAPCEAACVLGINSDAVTIKQVEVEIIDRAWEQGWVAPQIPEWLTGMKVAVVGSGPAGLAAAQQLTRAGHDVTVYESADRIGGLLRYGIPEFKMEKRHLDRRLAQMEAEGTRFVTGVRVGTDLSVEQLRSGFHAVVIATGATVPRDLPVPGRELTGIYSAMEYLVPANRVQLSDTDSSPIDAAGKHVVIIGGGDTGADCLGTAHRQGAASVVQLEIMPRPDDLRPVSTPWPTWPLIYRTSSAHEEGGERLFAVNTERFVGDESGNVRALALHEVDSRFTKIEGTEREIPADLVLLAMGFVSTGGAAKGEFLDSLGVEVDSRGRAVRDAHWKSTAEGVFVAGDAGRGQSLIVWAIAEGRAAAAAVDAFLSGASNLPAPIHPDTVAIAAR
ncbi:dihydropyrimidine dehydrogenase subunit A [Rhizocola hellebori]|uniref:Dihydropyrimidine dehydrogenase subunit A n=1 Tax=Rhizocola hellebori TaxID=1392758 RepID=A0A8J3Q445_9ACTN|nr:glutamate synthase subunit beta [Rhizocola hellebori]GIH02993.1 dihydropyrimidine dehydrogenase subunit A [Rhizocola hellebori]